MIREVRGMSPRAMIEFWILVMAENGVFQRCFLHVYETPGIHLNKHAEDFRPDHRNTVRRRFVEWVCRFISYANLLISCLSPWQISNPSGKPSLSLLGGLLFLAARLKEPSERRPYAPVPRIVVGPSSLSYSFLQFGSVGPEISFPCPSRGSGCSWNRWFDAERPTD